MKSRENLCTHSSPAIIEDEEMIRDRLEIALQQTLPTETDYDDLIKRDVTTLTYTELVQVNGPKCICTLIRMMSFVNRYVCMKLHILLLMKGCG